MLYTDDPGELAEEETKIEPNVKASSENLTDQSEEWNHGVRSLVRIMQKIMQFLKLNFFLNIFLMDAFRFFTVTFNHSAGPALVGEGSRGHDLHTSDSGDECY